MRLWHYKLIPVLPKEMLVSQWRECIAIKRQWEKGTLKHRLVSYVKDYNKTTFAIYVINVTDEMTNRGIKYNTKLFMELMNFCELEFRSLYPCIVFYSYPEHNNRYLEQCYYNLQEKYDRGIITQEEWEKIEECMN